LDKPGIDALEILPGGEIRFSLEQEVFSDTLGSLQHGDLLSATAGRLLLSQELVAPFDLFFDALDLGLDGLFTQENGPMLFSLRETYPTSSIGPLNHGDILSLDGTRWRTAEALYAAFQPVERGDFGLDALYVWPSGEIWFSPTSGFQDERWGAIGHGDLLSDQGYVVFRNLELVGAFQPIEDLSDFGLDALYVVTDETGADSSPPHFKSPRIIPDAGDVALSWTGVGRVFQVERKVDWDMGWEAVSPVIFDHDWVDAGAARQFPRGWYRVRQW
jgi:hypothetical protein